MNEKNIDKLLKDFFNRQNQHIPDEGFTESVLQALPDRGKIKSIHNKIIIFATIISSFIYLFIFSGGNHIVKVIQEVFTITLFVQIPSISSIAITGLIIWGIIALINLDKDSYIFTR